ncbi:MAG: YbjN domain-containing protein [Trueperaceae bacterium]|nr:YbjN domain-containing protein [Trueperaceae bacterium]
MRKHLSAREVNQESLARVVASAFYEVIHLDDGEVVTEGPELKITLRFINGQRLQLFSVFPVEADSELDTVLEALNLFNTRMRGTKAFLVTDEGPPVVVFDTDFDFSAGLSVKSLVLRMRRFESNVFQGFEFRRLLKHFSSLGVEVEPRPVATFN